MPKARFSVTMPQDTLERLDVYVKANGQMKNRSDAVTKFVEHGLDDYPPPRDVICVDADEDAVPDLLAYLRNAEGVRAVHTTD